METGLISELQLPPGFRFHPTDEELVVHYLSRKVSAPRPCGTIPIIADVKLYEFDPWDLPKQATFGEKEWYFFSTRDRKFPNGARPNRAAASGYWKATGTDNPVYTCGGTQKIGIKKTLVFYEGRAPRGVKTDWIMHEYRLAENDYKATNARRKVFVQLEGWVLCRIYKKKLTNQKSTSAEKLDLKRPSSCPLEEDSLASVPETDSSRLRFPPLSPLTGLVEQHGDFILQKINSSMLDTSEKGHYAYYQLDYDRSNSVVGETQMSVAQPIDQSISKGSGFLPGLEEKQLSLNYTPAESFKRQPNLRLLKEGSQDKAASFSRSGQ
ncbi:hypothetical protein O6H91_05G040900 [Diphasiastrum complanatum]|uniref:Uncharacterized protein n=2 Tax=Diphasiastrum complanatum TaxID=34168 RepID=A0ACC2DMU9_DIPCM|nr:hypothetical protein O6H91_05G036200 [Diphasiastrum complanatum]KAJ7555490.1 hypothetical protein O6H91_05G040900 [Diphasiastrum complanatum]